MRHNLHRSKEDVEVCRGSINMHTATITVLEFDDLRFDVASKETVYYLRGESKEVVAQWVDALETTKVCHEFLWA